jgi:4-hydroxy-2-oxoheptanedioate aldolase
MVAQAGLRVGFWLSLPSPEVAEIAGGAGFDFVLIDLEHGAIGVETMQRMLMALAVSGTPSVVRVPEGTEAWLKRVLDAGAAAVMVPRVEDAAAAARLAGWAAYGPEGRRGEGLGAGRAAAWGRDIDGYRRRWRERGGLILQIESSAGLEAAAGIAAVPGVTQLFFGPSDFSAGLGTGRDDPRVAAAARRVAEVARGAGCEAGSTRFGDTGFAGLAAMGFTHAADLNDVGLLARGLDGHRVEALAELGRRA